MMETKDMIDVVGVKADCSGCHACFSVCPVQAIEMRPDREGFLYPVISQEQCIHCDACKRACPSLHKPANLPLEKAYGCYAKDEAEHMTSSSGGFFAVLARRVLAENGLVCGAAFDENQAVCHVLIDSQEALVRLKETKYVQSTIGNTYRDIKAALKEKRKVLFSGTPCQVAGLKGYLGKEDENLICVDLICHGVPSPEIWQRYLREIAGGRKVERVTFRNKTQGVSKITLDYHLNDGSVVKENYSDSLYMKGFIQNLYVRPSCFACKYKGFKRCSDLTIGDFWSAREFHPQFFSENGVSAVIVHSKKGEAWLKKVAQELHIVRAKGKEVACWNENLLVCAAKNPKSEAFFAGIQNENLMELLGSLTQGYVKPEQPVQQPTLLSGLKRQIKKWIT